MAAIDKTYTNSWEEYQKLKEWIKDKIYTCPNGAVVNLNHFIYPWNKEDFKGDKLPIMNTSYSADYFFIKYCPLDFVKERMECVYGKEYIEKVKNGTSKFDTPIKKGKYVKQVFCSGSWSQKFNNFLKQTRRPYNFTVSCEIESYFMWYDEIDDKWLAAGYEFNSSNHGLSSVALLKCKTIKAVIRKLRKWYFPIGTVILVKGNYIGEKWKFIIRKRN